MGADSGQEKTEDATPKRLREARKKGQVPKSRDVSTIIVLIAVFSVMSIGMGWMGMQIREVMVLSFQQAATKGPLEGAQIYMVGKAALLAFGKIMLPILMVGVIVAALAGFLQVGAIFAMEPLKPQFKKLNALEGLKNLFKTQTLIELVKNIAKIFIVFYLAYSTIKGEIFTILQTTNIPVSDAAGLTGSLLFHFIIKVLIAFLIISLIDFMVQKKQFMKQMKMTKDEVKREYKQDEGDPLIKGHRKQLHREFAFSDVKQQVAQSDVVVTNPTHVAVAIKYNREEMIAPEVSARGQRAFADMIKEIAEENKIPIMRNIPLAWALFELEEGAEIPEELYSAVAEILAYIYRMKQLQEQKEPKLDKKSYV
jgi:flagellar biosynthesis protein FlhB